MIIDAHQHYWMLRRGDYGWLTPDAGSLLYRDYMPELLRPELQRLSVTGTIVVQAAPTVEETEFLLELCEHNETLLGVVGWLDVSGADFAKHFSQFRANPRFVGIRPQFPEVPDGDWKRHPQLLHNLALLAEDGFPIDLLVRASDMPAMVKLLEQVPKLAAIVDHLGNPDIAGKQMELWVESLTSIAKFANTAIKQSGMATGAGGGPWQATDVAPYVKHAVDVFGPERLMFGSDWPVCLQAGDYKQMLVMVAAALPSGLTGAQIKAIFGGNAIKLYHLQMK